MITHTRGKNYQCILCEKSFMNITILNKHMMVHTEEKPYQCHDCGQHCIDNETFIEHIKIHNTAKPHKCSYCQKSFLLTNIWCLTQMKNLISVMSVGGFYKQWYLYRTYEDHINVTSHTSAGIVKRVSYITFIWKDTWEVTLERNHINVVIVTDKSFTQSCVLTLHMKNTHSGETISL